MHSTSNEQWTSCFEGGRGNACSGRELERCAEHDVKSTPDGTDALDGAGVPDGAGALDSTAAVAGITAHRTNLSDSTIELSRTLD